MPETDSNPPTDADEATESVDAVLSDGPAVDLTGRRLAGRYQLDARLGRGTFGVVYRAHDLRVDGPVAVKVLHGRRLDVLALERTKREVRWARDVHSPHLVKVLDLVEDEGLHFLVMELVTGSDVRRLLRQRGALPPEEVVSLLDDILAGLEDLHAADIVHRDVKPANLLLDEAGRVRLADFGLSRPWREDQRLTRTGAAIGSPAYRAPDASGALSSAFDLYSTGVVAFEMLTGRLPFEADDAVDMLHAHLRQPVPDLRSLCPEAPEHLVRLVEDLLAKDPADRPSAEVARARLRSDDAVGPGATGASTRATDDPPTWRRWLVVGLLSMMALTVGFAFRRSDPLEAEHAADARAARFDHVVGLDDAYEGRGTQGELLWRIEGLSGAIVAARFPDGPRLVSILFDNSRPDDPRRQILEIRDPETSEVLDTLALRFLNASNEADAFSDVCMPVLWLSDLDDDGVDEVWISLAHRVYWPQAVYHFDSARRQLLRVFDPSGHHRPIGGLDVDGDGHREMIFAGFNNRLGYQPSLVALRVPTPQPPGTIAPPTYGQVTPDSPLADLPARIPAWSTLLPADLCVNDTCFRIDEVAGEINTRTEDGEPVRIDRWGKVIGSSAVPSAERLRILERAYRAFRRAERAFELDPRAARSEYQVVADLAESVAEEGLAHWARVRHAQAGHGLEGVTAGELDAAWHRLVQGVDDEAAVEVAFQAAVTWYLHGDVDRTIAWAERSLDPRVSDTNLRIRWEPIELLTLALVDAGRADEVAARIEPLLALFPRETLLGAHVSYAAWRRGEPPIPFESRDQMADLPRYWSLEFDAANGTGPSLERIEHEALLASETKGLVAALHAHVLRGLGRTEEADLECRRALRWIESERTRLVTARSHEDVVRARCGPAAAVPSG